MKFKLMSLSEPRFFMLVLSTGDRLPDEILSFAEDQEIKAASISGIGAFLETTVGFFNWETKEYDEIEFPEPAEVLSFTGNLALRESKPALHAHVVLSMPDGSATGGHFLRAIVRPTLELVITEMETELHRAIDDESRLPLIEL